METLHGVENSLIKLMRYYFYQNFFYTRAYTLLPRSLFRWIRTLVESGEEVGSKFSREGAFGAWLEGINVLGVLIENKC